MGVYDREQDNLTINYTIQPAWNCKYYRETHSKYLLIHQLLPFTSFHPYFTQLIVGRPPTDVSTPQSQLLNPIGIYTMNFVIGVGIIVAVALLVFNIVTIRKP